MEEQDMFGHLENARESLGREDYVGAFSSLKYALNEAKLEFLNDDKALSFIVEVLKAVTLIETGLKKSFGDHLQRPQQEDTTEACSFCGKYRSAVIEMVAGQKAFICDGCLRVYARIIEQQIEER